MQQPRGIIVLEGADCTGKTTLAKGLVERFDGVYIHNRYHKNIWPFFMASMRWAIRESQRRLVVIDRHWISECIYARVYRGGSTVPWDVRGLHRVLRTYGAVYVICAPPVEAVVDNHKRVKSTRKEMYDDVKDVAHRYCKLWDGGLPQLEYPDYVEQISAAGAYHHFCWQHYDFHTALTDVAFKREQDRIIEYLHLVRSRTHDVALDNYKTVWEVAGNLKRADAIFIADRPGGNRPNWPFCHHAGSSSYLNGALHGARVDEDAIAFVNTNGQYGPLMLQHLNQLEFAIRSPTIIVMGSAAENACDNAGVIVDAKIPHPQYARRFHFHGDYYVNQLKRALEPVGASAYLPVR